LGWVFVVLLSCFIVGVVGFVGVKFGLLAVKRLALLQLFGIQLKSLVVAVVVVVVVEQVFTIHYHVSLVRVFK